MNSIRRSLDTTRHLKTRHTTQAQDTARNVISRYHTITPHHHTTPSHHTITPHHHISRHHTHTISRYHTHARRTVGIDGVELDELREVVGQRRRNQPDVVEDQKIKNSCVAAHKSVYPRLVPAQRLQVCRVNAPVSPPCPRISPKHAMVHVFTLHSLILDARWVETRRG